jgi:hypothetical protein
MTFGDQMIDDLIDELEARRQAASVLVEEYLPNGSQKADDYRNLIEVLDRMLEAAV